MPRAVHETSRRTRQPRVHITYEVEVGDAIQSIELPFVIGVLADLSAKSEEPLQRVRDRNFVDVDKESFDLLMTRVRPRLAFTVPNVVSGEGSFSVELTFRVLADFTPDRLTESLDPLRELVGQREGFAQLIRRLNMSEAARQTGTAMLRDAAALTALTADGSEAGTAANLPDSIQRALAVMESDPERRTELLPALTSIASGARLEPLRPDEGLWGRVEVAMAAVDGLLSRQLSLILHHEEFRALEATWRGLWYLVSHASADDHVRVRVLNVAKSELLKEIARAPEFSQSALFKKVYEEEFGIFGGTPYGILVGDYCVSKAPKDLLLLEGVSVVAAAAHAPFIAAAAPAMFNLESFSELGAPRDLRKIFDTVEYSKWRALRESDDSRYLGLCVPRVLLRAPWVPTDEPALFRFTEETGDSGELLWGNAAYVVAARTAEAFASHGWCINIRGLEQGGLIDDLPSYTQDAARVDRSQMSCVEYAINDYRERELAELGFIPLVQAKGRPFAAIFSVNSVYRPRRYDAQRGQPDEGKRTQINYLLTLSRFAHYIKAIVRDKAGSWMSRDDLQGFLNRWISQYVLLDDDASSFRRAEYPLREASVDVVDVPGRPGDFRAIVYIRPHFQSDATDASSRITVDVAQAAR